MKEGFFTQSYQEFARGLYEAVAELRGREFEEVEEEVALPSSTAAEVLERQLAEVDV